MKREVTLGSTAPERTVTYHATAENAKTGYICPLIRNFDRN
jgi:hypothetical protein